MFCRKCGKYISYEADTCNECKAMENGMPPAYTAVMDSTATSLASDNSIPVVVFALKDPENIWRVVTGEQIGTIVEK